VELTNALRIAGTCLAGAAALAGVWWVSRAREASEDYEVALSLAAYALFLVAIVIGVVELWRQ